ncbi:MAG TPA: hypothetical protein VFV68_07855 [Agriterribacter sp.]|nr:hypothetical protein [Agriterribacter sp.]
MLTIQKKSLRVGRYVSTKDADTIIRTYKQERWVHNSEHLGKEDSLSVWYTIEELEEFLSRSKAHGGDGIKFYFSAYPKNYEERPEYAGRQTILLVATKTAESETGVVNKDIYTKGEEGVTILAYNSGSLCPPMCGDPRPPKPVDADDWGMVGVTIVDRGKKGLTVV